MPIEPLDSYSTQDLAQACAEHASRRPAPPCAPDPCYELFRRAFALSPDQEAWRAILNQYHRLVRHWLRQYAEDDTVQEVFERFWRAQKNAEKLFVARFPNIGAVMGFIKSCAATVRIKAWREEERQRELVERLCSAPPVDLVPPRTGSLPDHTDFKQLVLSRLKNEGERVVFELTYHYGLSPGDIQAERPHLFPDVQTVYRVKENLLKRLRRDQDLKRWWADGGNSSV
jgi:DNA-directed RNA polymerase specialized sigma24 family protein